MTRPQTVPSKSSSKPVYREPFCGPEAVPELPDMESSAEALSKFDFKTPKLLRLRSLKKDLRTYWIDAVQKMTDEQLAVFDVVARPFSGVGTSGDQTLGDRKALPVAAPQTYRDRKIRSDRIHQFIERIYGDWLDGKSMSRADFRRLDPKGAAVLDVWLQTHDMPIELKFRTIESETPRLDTESLRTVQRLIRRAERLQLKT